jgi:hypothetical protein
MPGKIGLYAQPIPYSVVVTLPDGSQGTATLWQPACRLRLRGRVVVADAVTLTGPMQWVPAPAK